MRPTKEDLRTAIFAADVEDQAADAITNANDFAGDLLVPANDAFGAAEIDDDMAEFHPLDHAGDDLARAVLELLILALALGIADLLEDHLLRRLSGDTAEFDRGKRIDDEVTDDSVLLQLLRVVGGDLLEIVVDLFDDLDHAPQPHVPALRVDLGADVVLGAITGAGRALDRILHRLDHDLAIDQLLARDGVCNGEKFSLVCGNGGGHGRS